MGKQIVWRRGNPLTLDIAAPLDKADPSAHLVVDAAVATGYLYDRRKQSEAILGNTGGAVSIVRINPDDTGKFAIGDIFELFQDYDTTRFSDTITTIDTATGDIGFAGTTTAGWAIGGRFIKRLGAPIVGAAYGTPALTSVDWGYTVQFPAEHGQIATGGIDELQELLAEVVLFKVATGARLERSWDVLRTDPRLRL